MWEDRFATPDYLFGTEPASFLRRHADWFQPGLSVLSVAEGEGRNAVFLAERGLRVRGLEYAPSAIAKAHRLAADRGVSIDMVQADVMTHDWAAESRDVVIGIFIQFAPPADRARLFAGMAQAVRPGGLILLHGYRPEQVALGTGGPKDPAHMYTDALLRDAYPGWDVLLSDSYDAMLSEGTGHVGRSALIDFIARKPAEPERLP